MVAAAATETAAVVTDSNNNHNHSRDVAQTPADSKFDQDSCERLASRILSLKELPMACHQYPAAVKKVKAKEHRLKTGDAYSGMPAGMAVQARASQKRGAPHFAQVQRRRTAAATTGARQFWKDATIAKHRNSNNNNTNNGESGAATAWHQN